MGDNAGAVAGFREYTDHRLCEYAAAHLPPCIFLKGTVHALITLDVHHARRYYEAVIVSFKCTDTQALARRRFVKRFEQIAPAARRKLRQLEIAGRLDDLRVPPGNRLEALKGDRQGQHSIRVNDRYRICFRWSALGAKDVEIVDYHG